MATKYVKITEGDYQGQILCFRSGSKKTTVNMENGHKVVTITRCGRHYNSVITQKGGGGLRSTQTGATFVLSAAAAYKEAAALAWPEGMKEKA